MNDKAKNILELLNNNGYEAYIIGGYVRDYLFGIDSNDYDICTNCSIDRLKEILSDYNYKIELCTMTINMDNINIEITPYRKEIEYSNRRPINYEYTNILEEDLLRRDFTINTICIDSNLNIIDKLNGKEDLDNRIIRCIGNIEQKLIEDPLRILRCLRFSVKYNLDIDNDLKEYIKKYSYLVERLSYDRKKEEIIKLIEVEGLSILKEYNIDKCLDIDLTNIKYYPNTLVTLIKIDINNKYCITKYEKNIKNIVNKIDIEGISSYNLYRYGTVLCDLYNIDISTYNNLVIHNRKDININSYDIIDIVKDETRVESIYTNIEKAILNKEIDNDYNKIIEYVNKIC